MPSALGAFPFFPVARRLASACFLRAPALSTRRPSPGFEEQHGVEGPCIPAPFGIDLAYPAVVLAIARRMWSVVGYHYLGAAGPFACERNITAPSPSMSSGATLSHPAASRPFESTERRSSAWDTVRW